MTTSWLRAFDILLSLIGLLMTLPLLSFPRNFVFRESKADEQWKLNPPSGKVVTPEQMDLSRLRVVAGRERPAPHGVDCYLYMSR